VFLDLIIKVGLSFQSPEEALNRINKIADVDAETLAQDVFMTQYPTVLDPELFDLSF